MTHTARVATLRRSAELPNELSLIIQNDQRSGTKMAVALTRIDRCLGAAYSFFCIIYKGTCYPEYLMKPWYRASARIVEPSTSFSLADSFLEKCHNPETFTWPKNFSAFPLEAFFPLEQLTRDNIDYFFLVTPVIRDDMTIGAFINVFVRTNLWFDGLTAVNILQLTSKLLKEPINHIFQRRVPAMIVEPIFKSRKTLAIEKRVFVLMPFREPWSDRIWTKLIKPICLDCGMEAIRADDLYGRDIIEDIWDGICTSRLVIADITGRNANVFYELGIAHTLGKDVVLLTQSISDIPFDLNRYRHIIYQDNMDGYELLKSELAATIKAILS